MSPVMEGGDFVKRAREYLGLGPVEFGEKLGVTRQTVWRYERGDPLPKATRLAIEHLLIAYERANPRNGKQKRATS